MNDLDSTRAAEKQLERMDQDPSHPNFEKSLEELLTDMQKLSTSLSNKPTAPMTSTPAKHLPMAFSSRKSPALLGATQGSDHPPQPRLSSEADSMPSLVTCSTGPVDSGHSSVNTLSEISRIEV